jgi:hypothetical protein
MLLQHHKAQVVAQRRAEAIIAVWKRRCIARLEIAASKAPCDERVANVDDRHLNAFSAPLAHPMLGGGKHDPTKPAALSVRIDRQRSQIPCVAAKRFEPHAADGLIRRFLHSFQERRRRLGRKVGAENIVCRAVAGEIFGFRTPMGTDRNPCRRC